MISSRHEFVQSGAPVLNEERFRTPELFAALRICRAINVILQGDGTQFGALEVDCTSEGAFSSEDITFLQSAANIIGMAMNAMGYHQNLRAALEHRQVLLKEINHRVKTSLQSPRELSKRS